MIGCRVASGSGWLGGPGRNRSSRCPQARYDRMGEWNCRQDRASKAAVNLCDSCLEQKHAGTTEHLLSRITVPAHLMSKVPFPETAATPGLGM